MSSRIARGIGVSVVSMIVSRVVQFATTAFLAHVLAPEHFGALALALSIQLIAQNASELGATASIGRATEDPGHIAPTVYTIALVSSAVLTAAMCLGAGWFATLLGDPDAAPLIRVLSFTVFLGGICSVPSALIWRDYHQGRKAVADLVNLGVTTATVIPFALIGLGGMSLGWSRLLGQLAATIIFLVAAPKHYLPGWNTTVARGVLRLGMPLALANVVVFATLNVDYVVIGRRLGPVELGVYLLAFNLASLPSSVFTTLMRAVALPTLGRLQALGRLPEAIRATMTGLATLAFPVCSLLMALGIPLMGGIYGPTWAPGAAALLGLGLFTAGRVLTEAQADAAVAAGRTAGLLAVQVVWLLALVPAMVIGVTVGGIAGAGWAHAIVVWAVVVPAYGVVTRRAAGVTTLGSLGGLVVPLIGAVLCGLSAWLVSGVIDAPVLALAVGSAVGLAVYAATVASSTLRFVRRTRTQMTGTHARPAGASAPLGTT